MVHTLAVILAALAINITSTLTAPVAREFNELETPKNTELFTRGDSATNCPDSCLGDGERNTGPSSPHTDSRSSFGGANWGARIPLNQPFAVTDPPDPLRLRTTTRASRALAAHRAAVVALPKPLSPPDPEADARAQHSLADYRAAAVASRHPVRRVSAVANPRRAASRARNEMSLAHASRLLAAHQEGVVLADQDSPNSS